jgi:hypothetical protein
LQHKTYLKGFFFHSLGLTKDAVNQYKESLIIGGTDSWNWCRKAALENLNLFFRERKIDNKLIRCQLRKHVVHRRSIVVLLDTKFQSDFYLRAANRFVSKLFKSLNQEDYFGYICIGNESRMPCPELRLEKKS